MNPYVVSKDETKNDLIEADFDVRKKHSEITIFSCSSYYAIYLRRVFLRVT